MNLLHRLLRRIATDLGDAQVRFALVGGLAVSARVEPRFTQDVDLAVGVPSDVEAEALVRMLTASGYSTAEVFEQTAVGRLATVRFDMKDGRALRKVDLLFASSGIEPEAVRDAQDVEIVAGLTVPVAQLPHLIAMKTLSVSERRPKDLIDLQAMIETASEEELAQARELTKLIVTRGYHNDRDLTTELDSHIRKWRAR